MIKEKTWIRLTCIVLVIVMFVVVCEKAEAVPAFARKYSLSCTKCHIAFPKLNSFGRQFKMNGYVRERGETEDLLVTDVSDDKQKPLILEKSFPWAGLLKLLPYDNTKLRAFNELDLLVAGNITGDFSYFTGLYAIDDFMYFPILGAFKTGYHMSQQSNIIFANHSFFMIDPFQTLSNQGLLTRSLRQAPSQAQISGVSLDTMMQTILFYGQLVNEGVSSLYYSAGISADNSDPVKGQPKNVSARISFDTYKDIIIGGFTMFGSMQKNSTQKYDYSRTGIDALIKSGNINVQGMVMQYYDKDLLSGLDERNNAFYIEALYVIKAYELPVLAPLLRYDKYEKANGMNSYSSLTVQLSHYAMPNVKANIEYWLQTEVPTVVTTKNSRLMLQIEIGF